MANKWCVGLENSTENKELISFGETILPLNNGIKILNN